jgi:septum formation protein
MTQRLILASTSRYRAALLSRLGVPFETGSPGVDEQGRGDESPRDRAVRLARAKAHAVAGRHPDAWVLGSDQLAVRGTEVLGKPGNAACCEEQLLSSSGQPVVFLTAACLLRASDGRCLEHVDTTLVQFRTLTRAEVRRYVEIERPLDCAGGFKCEGLGIALFESIDSRDPTALIGLPMIWVADALRRVGLDPLGVATAAGGLEDEAID